MIQLNRRKRLGLLLAVVLLITLFSPDIPKTGNVVAENATTSSAGQLYGVKHAEVNTEVCTSEMIRSHSSSYRYMQEENNEIHRTIQRLVVPQNVPDQVQLGVRGYGRFENPQASPPTTTKRTLTFVHRSDGKKRV